MTPLDWTESPIGRHHDRVAFDCGSDALNDFLKRFARQSHRLGGAKTYIASPDSDPVRVLGFYSLSPASLLYADTPEVARRGLARHDVPVFRLARLAVDRSVQGRGLGGALLIAAGKRCLAVAQEVGGVALLIDAKDERAASWYEGYGAVRLLDARNSLVLPFATLRAAIEADAP